MYHTAGRLTDVVTGASGVVTDGMRTVVAARADTRTPAKS